MPHLIGKRMFVSETPFAGSGVSLYAQLGSDLVYRRPLPYRGHVLPAADSPLRAATLSRTTRVAFVSAPDTAIDYTFPAAWLGQQITLNVRTFADGIENDDLNARTLTLNEDGEIVDAILGTAVLIAIEKRDGGIVRIRFAYLPSRDGLPPVTFAGIKTAGTGSVADVSADYVAGTRVYELDTPALTDGEAYTYKIQAVNGSVTADLVPGITFTADGSGPPEPTGLTATPI